MNKTERIKHKENQILLYWQRNFPGQPINKTSATGKDFEILEAGCKSELLKAM